MSETLQREKVRRLLDAIEQEYAYSGRFSGLPAPSKRVMAALAEVPREEFVPPEMRPFAYDNRPLPIGKDQTISQPFIVALMTDLLMPEEDDVILEVGTGSGYQSAVLSRLVKKVYSIEIIEPLAAQAQAILSRLDYTNIEVRTGNGRLGWPEHAPYDGIIVTAAAPVIPPALIEQLKPRARLVVPVSQGGYSQELIVVEKDENGHVTTRDVLSVAFVPLTGGDRVGG